MKTINERGVTSLYHSSPAARAILNSIAAMPKQKETRLDVLEERLSDDKEVNRRNMVTVFKQLEDFGVGEFIPGRKGHPSRFVWHVDSVNISTLDVAPLPHHREEMRTAQPAAEGHSTSFLITHRFQLRQDLAVTFLLPADISAAEALRLSNFIQTLPFGA